MKLLSVIMPVYNTKADYLNESIVSIINQTYQNFDFLILDDGSTNKETTDYLKKLGKHEDVKIFFEKENQGTPVALNKLHQYCTTPWIALMGSDDISVNWRLATQMHYLAVHDDVDILGSGLKTFSENPNHKPWTKIHPAIITSMPESGWVHNHGTVIYRKESIDNIGGYNYAWRRGQDIELWKRAFKSGLIMHNIPDILYLYRK